MRVGAICVCVRARVHGWVCMLECMSMTSYLCSVICVCVRRWMDGYANVCFLKCTKQVLICI